MYKVFILILTSFVGGIFFSQYIELNQESSLLKTQQELITKSQNNIDTNQLEYVYTLIKENFYKNEDIDTNLLIQWAIEWMVQRLWDKNTEFMIPETTQRFFESLSWDFEWIWAVVEKVNLWVQVERVIQGSPALSWDIRSWDIIVKANEVDLWDLDLYDAVEQIKWPAGTKVILEILRSGNESLMTKEIIRQKIQIPSVEHEIFEEENYGYIRINMFGQTTAKEFRDALREIEENNPGGLIVDVRNNGGWYLESAVEILSEFIESWENLVSIRYRDSLLNTNFTSKNDWNIFNKKIVVLINENSASASEITAWALREYNKALLIGKKSYWKWSVQEPFNIEGWSLLKLTVANWYTPLWKNIELEGISPDIEISFLEEDYENMYDRQLEEAKVLLKLFIEKNTPWLTLDAYRTQFPIKLNTEELTTQ